MRRALPIAALLVAILAAGHARPPRLEIPAVADLSALDENMDVEELAQRQFSEEAVEMIQDEETVLDGGSNTSTPCNNSSSDKTAAQSQAEKDAAATSAMAALGMKPNHTQVNNTAVQKNVTSFAKSSAKIQKAVEAKAKKGVGKMVEGVLGKNISATLDANATANASNVTQQSSNASNASDVSLVSSNGTNGTANLTLSKKTDKDFAKATKAKQAQQEAALKAMGMKKDDIDPPPVECDNATNASNSTPAPAPPPVEEATDTSDMPSGLLNTYSELNGNGGKETGAADRLEVVAR